MAGIIAGYKIDKLSDIMVSDLSIKMDKIKGELSRILHNECIKLVPNNVLEVWKQHPQVIIMERPLYVELGSKDYSSTRIPLNSPKLPDEAFEKLKASECFINTIEAYANKYNELYDLRIITRGKIKCTVSKLKTYNKLKVNFPEAYKVLVETIDGDIVLPDSGNLCDSIEELRAELNSNKS